MSESELSPRREPNLFYFVKNDVSKSLTGMKALKRKLKKLDTVQAKDKLRKLEIIIAEMTELKELL